MPAAPPDIVAEATPFEGRVDTSGPYPRIRAVRICGLVSEHGYDYSPRAWDDAAIRQYEGLPSYVGHAAGVRHPADKVGWFENVRRRPDGTPEGDYCLNPKHPLAESVVWAAEHRPDFYAVSHRAHVGRWGTANGRRVVEGIGQALSVDLVSVGGTNGGLAESHPGERAVSQTVTQYADALGRRCNLAQIARLRWLVQEDDGDMGDAPMMADAPPPDAATDPDDGVSAAFLSAATAKIQACMDAKGDPVALKKCLGKLKKLLMAHGELAADDDPDADMDGLADAEDDDPAEPLGESAPARRGKGRGKGADAGTLLEECAAEQWLPSPTQLKAFRLLPHKADRTAFIREQKGYSRWSAPRSAARGGPVEESGGSAPLTPQQEADADMERRSRKLSAARS